MKIGLVIFTKNERKNSEKIFNKIPFEIFDKTYVIDGNSTDGTQDFWKKKKVKVFGQKYPGVGGAYESAYKNTKEDALVFFHPDGNGDPNALFKFVGFLKAGADFVVASRMMRRSSNEEDDQLIKSRKWGTQAFGLIANIIWGNRKNYCTDVTQGYRAITRSAYKKLKIKIPDATAPDYEQVIRALKNNILIEEFPTNEGSRVHGGTTMPSFSTGMKNLKVLLRELHIF